MANRGGEFEVRGVAGWLWSRLHGARAAKPRMALVQRIVLGPRQSLALVEADGRRFLVATAGEGGPTFLALDGRGTAARSARISW